MTVKTFEGQYECFSNFYPRVVTYNGALYKTKEHAYQCQKATNQKDFESIFYAPTPYQAKKWSRTIRERPDWKKVNIKFMHEIVLAFFLQWEDCRTILVSTRTEELQEGNTWGDRFWGMVDGKGENWLGKILMDVRSIILGHPSTMFFDLNQL